MKPLATLLLLLLTGRLYAQQAQDIPAPNSWVVRTFQFDPLASDMPESFGLPAIDHTTPAAEIVAEIRREAAAFEVPSRAILPLGSAALHDRKSGTFVLRTTARAMKEVELYFEFIHRPTTRNCVHTLDVIQAPGPVMQQVARDAAPLFDQTPLLERLESLIAQSQAKHLETLRVETGSGRRAKSESTHDMREVTDLTLDENGRLTSEVSSNVAGTSLEIEDTFNGSLNRTDGACVLEFHFAPPSLREERVLFNASRPPLAVAVSDFHRVFMNQQFSTLSGGVKLLGLWRPEGTPELAAGDVMQAAFMRSSIVKIIPAPNKELEKIFRDLVDEAVPLPKGEPVQTLPPPGMETRSFYRSIIRTVFPAFRPEDQTAAKEKESKPEPVTPISGLPGLGFLDITSDLIAAGIPFPQGAVAISKPGALRVLVTNTPENLELVRQYLDVVDCDVAYAVTASLHIIQTDAATVRQLAAREASSADQTETLRDFEKRIAEGKATSVQMLHVEGWSGTKLMCETGPAWAVPAAVRLDDKGRQVLHHDYEMKGTRLEIETSIGADGLTIDLAVEMEHHFSPPTFRPEPPAGAGKTEAFISPVPEFHFAKVSTNTTVRSGMTRLVGVWQTDGPAGGKPGDLMQAAFITVHKVTPETDPKK